MDATELACKLDTMMDAAPVGERMVTAILFGVRYHEELGGTRVREVVQLSQQVTNSEEVEIRYGIKLARYVVPKEAGSEPERR